MKKIVVVNGTTMKISNMVLYISIGAIAFAFTIIILSYCLDWYLDNWMINIITAIVVVAAFFVLLCPIINSDHKDSCIKAQQTYEELLLYKDVVDTSDNESLRYNYYQKVSDWNAKYYDAAEKANNETFLYWWGPYWCNVYYGTGSIEFELRDG